MPATVPASAHALRGARCIVPFSARSLRQPATNGLRCLSISHRSNACASLSRSIQAQVHHPSAFRAPLNGRRAAFSSSAPARRAEDETSVPRDDIPKVENPTPEQTLDIFEGLARTQYEGRIQHLYETPSEYCAAIINNMNVMGHFLLTVDRDELRSSTNVAPDSAIARGRAALMLTARTTHRWMQEAYPPHAPPSDEDVAEAMIYFAMNDHLMDIYEAGGPEPVPQWQDICDFILLAHSHAIPALKRIAGPMPENLVVFEEKMKERT
ncbi:uncharacterized protein C8Q71DRAFT_729032 [Rhodofomes roseus]|uniref:Uncharacterized protein n=1 Tax=Rhodofomes roseus TaxID=34475 RepID=A0ABQ8KW90_9APHY|nr:uncharacterized protein C8Q71DRAFT_729032 [Rhodofomes roseus]KAH9843572.1 hypothetical protein C8Q71DRAFT_729032 [Rhodofomes roseus]